MPRPSRGVRFRTISSSRRVPPERTTAAPGPRRDSPASVTIRMNTSLDGAAREKSLPTRSATDNAILAVSLVAAAAGAAFFSRFVIDDAFITFRYARNLAQGAGLVWNPHEPPVEGFTNFSWMVLCWIGELVGLSPIVTTKTLGALSAAAISWAIFDTLKRLSTERVAVLVSLSFSLCAAAHLHAASGLETTFFSLLMLATVRSALGVSKIPQPLLVLLAGLTRPEGLVFGGISIALTWLRNPSERSRLVRQTALLLVLPGAVYFAWRWHTFESLFPNTFYVKSSGGNGIGNVLRYGVLSLPAAVFVIWAAVLKVRDRSLVLPESVRHLLVFCVASVLSYGFFNLLMDFAWRFYFHLFPAILLLTGLLMGQVFQARGPRPVRSSLLIGALVPLFFVGVGIKATASPLLDYGPQLEAAHGELGRTLAKSSLPAELRTIAIGDAGAVPFYSGWTTIDTIGLNDREIARKKNPTERVLNAEPSLVVVYSRDGKTPNPAQFGLVVDQLDSKYKPVGSIQFAKDYYLFVMLRNGLESREGGQELERAIQGLASVRPEAARVRAQGGP